MALIYRREIDGLRAIAVGAVVSFHAIGAPFAGFAGVDIFFVISGYLITALLVREYAETRRISLLDFYARRVRRILPAAAFMIFAVLVAAPILLHGGEAVLIAESATASILFVANIYFQGQTGGYFDANADALPLLHMWSLSVEEQFYVLWPLLLTGLLRWRRSTLTRDLALLAFASLVVAEAMIAWDKNAAFYQTPARLWELALGGIFSTLRRPAPKLFYGLGLAMIGAGLFVPVVHFPGLGALPVVAGTGFVLWSIQSGATNRILASRLIVGVGLISYSLYLWHWPLLAFYRAITIGEGSSGARLALCGVAVAIAVFSYLFIETPFRRQRSARRSLVAGGLAIALLCLSACAIVYTTRRAPAPPATVASSIADNAERDLPKNYDECHRYQAETPGPECDSGLNPQVAIWGDSFALAWQPLARSLGQARTLSTDGCPPLLDYRETIASASAAEECARRNRANLRSLTGFDTVIIAAFWKHYVPAMTEQRRSRQREAIRASLHGTLAALSPQVRRVIIIGPSPQMQDKVPRCLRLAQDCSISRSRHQAETALNLAMLRAEASRFPNVRVFDPTAALCDALTCPAVRGGRALYFDEAHVTNSTAEAVAAEWAP